jgi:hypothetical protein
MIVVAASSHQPREQTDNLSGGGPMARLSEADCCAPVLLSMAGTVIVSLSERSWPSGSPACPGWRSGWVWQLGRARGQGGAHGPFQAAADRLDEICGVGRAAAQVIIA